MDLERVKRKDEGREGGQNGSIRDPPESLQLTKDEATKKKGVFNSNDTAIF